jgi:ring-1,2-phenylacetyl-CoA epoxidase subunit PaaD
VNQPGSALGSTLARAWRALESVMDPEIPALSIVELGLIRRVQVHDEGRIEVGLSPTYVGCPATDVIANAVAEALSRANFGEAHIRRVLSPAWSSEWITEEGRHKLKAYGIVPPERASGSQGQVLRGDKPLACPRCDSRETQLLSEFGSTPCKALHRCCACLEPFEHFKCI